MYVHDVRYSYVADIWTLFIHFATSCVNVKSLLNSLVSEVKYIKVHLS